VGSPVPSLFCYANTCVSKRHLWGTSDSDIHVAAICLVLIITENEFHFQWGSKGVEPLSLWLPVLYWTDAASVCMVANTIFLISLIRVLWFFKCTLWMHAFWIVNVSILINSKICNGNNRYSIYCNARTIPELVQTQTFATDFVANRIRKYRWLLYVEAVRHPLPIYKLCSWSLQCIFQTTWFVSKLDDCRYSSTLRYLFSCHRDVLS